MTEAGQGRRAVSVSARHLRLGYRDTSSAQRRPKKKKNTHKQTNKQTTEEQKSQGWEEGWAHTKMRSKALASGPWSCSGDTRAEAERCESPHHLSVPRMEKTVSSSPKMWLRSVQDVGTLTLHCQVLCTWSGGPRRRGR